MTKKHFISLADYIKSHNASLRSPFTEEHLRTLAAFCESNSPRFKRGRWLDYICGRVGPNGGKLSREEWRAIEHGERA